MAANGITAQKDKDGNININISVKDLLDDMARVDVKVKDQNDRPIHKASMKKDDFLDFIRL